MNVLHINCNYIGTTLHQLMVEHLEKQGCINSVFVPTYDKNLSIIVPNENVLVDECFRKWDRLFFDYKQSKIFNSVEKNYNVSSFDLIHAYTLFTDGNCARLLNEKYGVPYVVAVRGTDVNSFFKLMPHLRMRGVKNMLKASAIFFLSEAYKRKVFQKYIPKKYHSELQKKSYVIPNGIDEFWFQNISKKSDKLSDTIKLIYAGKIDKNKNIKTTQRAMKLLNERGYKTTLTVVGKVVDKKEYERIIKDSCVTYVPAMKKESLVSKYRENDIFVMPSFSETFGLVYAEAMSQGLPVVYSRGEGFDKQFAEGVVGFSACPKSARSVADAIEKVIVNYDLIKQNVSDCAKKFSWDKIIQQYVNIYKQIKE